MQLNDRTRGDIPQAAVEAVDLKRISNDTAISANIGLEGAGEITCPAQTKTSLVHNQRRKLALAKTDVGIVIVDLHIQLHGWRYIAIQVKHEYREAFSDLVGSTIGIRISVIEGVIAKRIGPITGAVDGKYTVLPLDYATIGHINEIAVEVLNLQGRNTIRGVDNNAPTDLLGGTAWVTAIGQGFFINHARPGNDLAFGILILNVEARREVHNLRLRNTRHFGHRELRLRANRPRGVTNNRINHLAGFTQQHKGVTAACATRTTSTARTRPGSSGFSVLRRVDAGLNGRLQFFDIGQLLLTGRRGRGLYRRIVCTISPRLGQQLAIEQLGAVTPKGQLAAACECHSHRTVHAGDQLLTGKHTITFG